ncbi:TetR family transcriptional regulator [Aquipuribacter hungaricus]|uniref:TetR family transcriptional regulator n=1 Tax=Aquipuribacter hungaricus TaxID=545624 RepID=A0ABV7WNH3_9MICO
MVRRGQADGEGPPPPRPRGRRAAGADTRGELLAAASAEFAEHGLDGTSMRGVARRAGVDPALVHHYFSSKEELFTESVVTAQYLPLAARSLSGVTREDAAETLVRTVLLVWGRLDGRGALRAVVASVARSEVARDLLRELVLRRLLLPLVRRLEVDEPERRAALVASQVVGLGMVRYVVRVEPLASADDETVVAEVAPTVARYLFGPLPPLPGTPPS